MISNFRHRASPATTQVTIRFFEPHKATIDGPAVSLLQEMSLDSRVASERRVALAKACGAVVFCRGAAIIDGGLVKAVQNVLELHGYEVAVIDATWGQYTHPAVDWNRNWLQSGFARQLEGRGRALVVSRNLKDQIDLLEVVCQRFPRATICAAVKNCEIALTVAAQLKGRVPQTVWTGMDSSGDNSPQLHLMAIGNFALASHCDYFVALGEAATVNQKVQQRVSPWRNCIRIAITDAPLSELRERDRVHVEAMYGPCLLDQAKLDPFIPVYAAVLAAEGSPVPQGKIQLQRKREHITRNAQRNRQIAQLAQRLRGRDATCLRAAGIEDLNKVIWEAAEPDKFRVAVIVESSAHARELQRHLPDWNVVSETSSAGLLGIEANADIVTLPAAAAVTVFAEVIVYAAGTGDGWIEACESQMSLTGSLQLVVDFADSFDEVARAEILNRVDDYRSRRWIVRWPGHDGRPLPQPNVAAFGDE